MYYKGFIKKNTFIAMYDYTKDLNKDFKLRILFAGTRVN